VSHSLEVRLPSCDEPSDVGQTRIECLLDPGTGVPLSHDPGSGVSTAVGKLDTLRVVTFATHPQLRGGALTSAGTDHIVDAIDFARAQGLPVVGLWHSGGAELCEGVGSLEGAGRMFAATIRASGVIPHVSVILGPAAGAAAYGPALTDVVIMSAEGRAFVTGPGVIRTVTGEDVDMGGLGGPAVHSVRSGLAHVVAADEPGALAAARRVTSLLGGGHRQRRTSSPWTPSPDPGEVLPTSARRAYDIHLVIRALVDVDPPGAASFQELQPQWAPNIVIGLAVMAGRTVGIIANNPLRKAGCLDALAAEKAARFVRMCDSLGIPLACLVDVPGYLPSVAEEWGGVIRRGAKLLHAFSEAVVPRVTVILRKSYGGAYIAMNSKSLGATKVFAWPNADVAVMGPEAAVAILHRKTLAEAHELERQDLHADLVEHQRRTHSIDRAVAAGAIDEIIEPGTTRTRLIEALQHAPVRRGGHANIPL